jgi:hypothetical protein
VSPQTDAPAWRWSNIPIPQAHLVGLGTGILLQGVRPWPLPWPAWIGHGGGWPLLLTGLWLGAWAEQLVPDEVWAAIQPLLPPKRPHPKGGRPWIEDRAGLGGIIYVLRADVPWRLPPAREFGCGQPSHLLAAAARLATRRGVGAAAPPAAGLAGRRRAGRLVTGVHRLG